jgi:hypothetical protein
MPLTDQAKSVIERPLPQEKIKQRPGKAGMTYDYVTPDFIIRLLNEAFDYRWGTVVTHREMVNDTAVVELQLTVWDADNNAIIKTQFGSCDVGRGMGPGEAFKGAASDAMKKAATLLGVALELYNDDEAPKQQFQKPAVPARPPVTPPAPNARVGVAPAPRPANGPAAPKPVAVAPPAPPRPAAPAPPAPPVPPRAAAPAAPRPPAAAPAPVAAPRKANPFANGGQTAAVPKPVAPPAPQTVEEPRSNPFASSVAGAGPNPTQLNALTNLSQRKGLSQPDMIALAGVVDETGNPKQTFDELSHAEAIQVIKASQL